MESDRLVTAKEVEFSTKVAEMLESAELDPKKNMPKGFLKRSGVDQTKNLPEDFKNAFDGLKQQYMSMMGSTYEKDKMSTMIAHHEADAKGKIIRHQAQEEISDYEKAVKASLDLAEARLSTFTDPKLVRAAVTNYTSVIPDLFGFKGFSKEATELALDTERTRLVRSAVMGSLKDNYMLSQQILEESKSLLSEKSYKDLQETIKGKALDQRSMNYFEVIKKFRNADGTLDATRAYNLVHRAKDMNVSEKDEIWKSVNGRIAEFNYNFHNDKINRIDAFLGQLRDGIKKGLSQDQLLPLATHYGVGNKEISELESVIKADFKKREEFDDKPLKVELYELIDKDLLSEEQLRQYYDRKMLHSDTYLSLKKDLHTKKKEGQNEAHDMAMDYAKKAVAAEGLTGTEKDYFLLKAREDSRKFPDYAAKVQAIDNLFKSVKSDKWYRSTELNFKKGKNDFQKTMDKLAGSMPSPVESDAMRDTIMMYRAIYGEEGVQQAIDSLTREGRAVDQINMIDYFNNVTKAATNARRPK